MEESTFSFEKLKVYQVARALVKDILCSTEFLSQGGKICPW